MPSHFALGRAGWLSPVVLAAVLLSPLRPPLAKAADQNVYAPEKLWQVHVTLSPEEYAAIEPRGNRGFPGFGPAPKIPDKPTEPSREVHRNTFGTDLPWGTGSVTIGDQTFDKVGIRYKGNGTVMDASRTIKKSFKIDLDRVGGSGRFGGSKSINLHCEVTDTTKCREVLGYAIYRTAGVPAPRTALAEVRLTVPGKRDKELLGVYTLVEEVDKPFLKDRFGDDKGLLMKPEGLREFDDRGDDWNRYKSQYAPKREPTKDEAKRVIAFARLVHKGDDATFKKEIGTYLDVDNYLRFLAATAFVANGDSLFFGHNFCLYLNPKTNKLYLIPWDLDRAFANFPILGSNSQQMNLSLTHPYPGTHRLTDRLLAVPEISDHYQKLLKELAATAFSKERLLKQLAEAEAAVQEPLERDQQAAAARKEVAGAVTMFGKPPGLKSFIEKRAASVAAQVAGTSKGHIPAGFGMGGPPKFGAMLAPPMMEAMDKNGDEYVSRDELLASMKRVWDACEKGKDDTVDLKALTAGLNKSLPPPPEGAPPGGFSMGNFMAGAIMDRADANKDKKLTVDEVLTATKAAFDEFDKKKAGKLDEEGFADMLTAVFPAPKFGPPAPPKDKK
ncbi:CotH kinase family protein [Gemmata sp. JC673]|uniref:CotH kinase family protein n=1 Tax=Gemmata algarum TaxID=2975278 RepID=A0ABU5F671_9BACT|nr:CotH kinase family protein [Gemmata algarum]MDY3561374.1 CotH kinase family protein [Gemmata algarum]